MNHTLDASAVLRLLDNEAGTDEVRRLFLAAYNQKAILYISTVNWSEILYTCMKRGGTGAQKQLQRLAALPFVMVPVDANIGSRAADYRLRFKLHLADAIALATAGETQSTLVTGDYDFKQPGTLPHPISFLPRK